MYGTRRTRHEGRQRPVGRPWQARRDVSLPEVEISQKKILDLSSTIASLPDENKPPRIDSSGLVATFNWKDSTEPTILIPGKPPRWEPPHDIPTLHEDAGIFYRDANGARFPSHPTEPALRAILQQNANFEVAEIDIFGCGSTFGSLLAFAQDEERTFRFGVELLGTSLFLVRKTNSLRETLEEVRGYGHTFPDAYTSWERDVKGSVSHQRIIKYNFAGLRCFVRSESDGYLLSLHQLGESDTPRKFDDSVADIEHLSQLSFLSSCVPADSTILTMEEAGQSIPQHAIFDLKTRTKKKSTAVSAADFIHRLWVNQTPNFVLAFHTHGKFKKDDIHIMDVRQPVKLW